MLTNPDYQVPQRHINGVNNHFLHSIAVPQLTALSQTVLSPQIAIEDVALLFILALYVFNLLKAPFHFHYSTLQCAKFEPLSPLSTQ
jgi:hypothetical protein